MASAPKPGLLDLYGDGEVKDGKSARRRAAKDVLQAIKDDDAEALDMALEAHYEECHAARGSEEDSEEED